MEPQEVVRSLAVLIALEDRATAEQAAEGLPPFLELVDCVRAADGAMMLAQILDARRRTAAASA